MLRPGAEALLVLRIIVLAALVPVVMRLPLAQVEAILNRGRVRSGTDPEHAEHIARLVDLALRVSGPLLRHTCLTRAVTRYYYLRHAGLDIALVFGVGCPAGAFAGHCWLEKDEEPFLESRDPRPVFVETHRISSGSTSLVMA